MTWPVILLKAGIAMIEEHRLTIYDLRTKFGENVILVKTGICYVVKNCH